MISVCKFMNNVLQKNWKRTINEDAADKKLIKCCKTANLNILIMFLYN